MNAMDVTEKPAASDTNLASTLTGSVAAQPGIALAAIVLLIVVIVFMYAQSQGYLSGLMTKTGNAAKKKKNQDKMTVDQLVDDINNAMA